MKILKNKWFNLCTIVVILISCGFISGCSKHNTNEKKKSQLAFLLEDFTNWDNTKTRIDKRHNNIAIPMHTLVIEFEKLSKEEKQSRSSKYIEKLAAVTSGLQKTNEVIMLEGPQVEYANRYALAAKSLFASYNNIPNNTNVTQQNVRRDLLDAWLGYDNAYSVAIGKGVLFKFDKEHVMIVRKGQTYEQIIANLKMPGIRLTPYIPDGQKDEKFEEIVVWAENEKYLLVKFREGKAFYTENKGFEI